MKSPEEKSQDHECRLAYEDFCPVCMKSKDSWEERFERLFVIPTSETRLDGRPSSIVYKLDAEPEEIKDFIRQVEKEAEERGYLRGSNYMQDYADLAYNQAIEEIKKRLPDTVVKGGMENGDCLLSQDRLLDIINNLK